MADLVKINFHGDVLDAIQDDGGTVWAGLRRLCENLGLDAEGQRKKLRAKAWACTEEKSVQLPGDTQARSIAMLDLDSIPGWLFSIDARKVRPASREKLVRYQRECARVLRDHFYGAPAAAPPPGLSPVDVTEIVMQTLVRVLPRVLPQMMTQAVSESHRILTTETVASRLARLLPHWSTNRKQRARITNLARSQVRQALGVEPLCVHPGSQLEFTPSMHYHLDTAIWQVYREACRDNEVDDYGLFREEAA